MAKAKSTGKSKASENKGKTQQTVIKIVVAVGLVGAGGWWYGKQAVENRFLDHVRRGDGTLDRVTRHSEHRTSGHLTLGERINYGSDTPTSGRHDSRAVSPGFYTSVQAPTMLVHSLERGMIVIYYDSLSAEAMAVLDDWSSLYSAPFSGILVTRRPGLGDKPVLTAWRKSLTLDSFDADAVATFIDPYRGRGPEHPVR